MLNNRITLGQIPGFFEKALEDEDVIGFSKISNILGHIGQYLEDYKGMKVFNTQVRAYSIKLKEALVSENIPDYKKLMDGFHVLVDNLSTEVLAIMEGGWVANTDGRNPFPGDSMSVEFLTDDGDNDYADTDTLNWSLGLGGETITFYRVC